MTTKTKKKDGHVQAVKPNSVAVVRSADTQRIVLPPGMQKLDAAEELIRQHEEDEKETQYSRTYKGYYYQDVLVAVKKACVEAFGWLDSRPTPGFFGPTPPRQIDVKVDERADGSAVVEQAYIGRIGVAPWGESAYLDTSISAPFAAGITAFAKKKHETSVQAFFDVVARILKEDSIYRNKAVLVSYSDPEKATPDGEPGGVRMEVTRVKPNPNIVLNEAATRVFEVLINADINSDAKRIYLFTGPYGNGKTETSLALGELARGRGYTFMYVKCPEQLAEVLVNAKRYMPAMVFMEDIDQIASGNERSAAINEILNTLDGTDLKGANLKMVFTTNHPDQLNVALRRPGRIDIVVEFNNPEAAAKREIVKKILGGVDGFDSVDLDKCVESLPDTQGAFIAEICKRAGQYADQMGGLTTDIFVASAESMRDHINLMHKEVEEPSTLADAAMVLGSALMGKKA